jgi:hypothetical protein
VPTRKAHLLAVCEPADHILASGDQLGEPRFRVSLLHLKNDRRFASAVAIPTLSGAWAVPSQCVRRSDDTDAPCGVASGPLAAGSALMQPHLFASERLSLSTRERVTWVDARNRNAITASAYLIDVELSQDAATKGAEIAEGLRAFSSAPLLVHFPVDDDDRSVGGLRVKRLRSALKPRQLLSPRWLDAHP